MLHSSVPTVQYHELDEDIGATTQTSTVLTSVLYCSVSKKIQVHVYEQKTADGEVKCVEQWRAK